jgi:hypothetical protein
MPELTRISEQVQDWRAAQAKRRVVGVGWGGVCSRWKEAHRTTPMPDISHARYTRRIIMETRGRYKLLGSNHRQAGTQMQKYSCRQFRNLDRAGGGDGWLAHPNNTCAEIRCERKAASNATSQQGNVARSAGACVIAAHTHTDAPRRALILHTGYAHAVSGTCTGDKLARTCTSTLKHTYMHMHAALRTSVVRHVLDCGKDASLCHKERISA